MSFERDREREWERQAAQRVAEGKSAVPELVQHFGSSRRAGIMHEAGERAKEAIHQQTLQQIASERGKK
jgi:hypothetical protein